MDHMRNYYLGGFCTDDEILVDPSESAVDTFVKDEAQQCGWCGEQTVPETWSQTVEKCYMVEPNPLWDNPEAVPTGNDSHAQGYNHWYYDENGGRFDREEYLDLFRDLGFAYGNPTNYNPESAYFATGLTGDPTDENSRVGYYLKNIYKPNGDIRDHKTGCENLATWMASDPFEDFYDSEYNPDGSYLVILYCDRLTDNNGDVPPASVTENVKLRRFDMGLAIDYNKNGIRDYGEPILRQFWENYDDCGTDGLCNEDEVGYNADSNPDPAGDDYKPNSNPTGTEGNFIFDAGETYLDYGIDGVVCPGCESGCDDPGCDPTTCGFDYGECNGEFDYNPNVKNYMDLDPRQNAMKLSDDSLRHVNFWMDAGIRDIFNFVLMGDALYGTLKERYEEMGLKTSVFQRFTSVMKPEPDYIGKFNFLKVNYSQLGQAVLIRYGDYNATDNLIMNGDGRHVGYAAQTVFRVQTFFAYADMLFPNGDYEPVETWGAGELIQKLYFDAPTLNRVQKYSVALPPGYWTSNTKVEGDTEFPHNCTDRYPVIYLGHGYGMEPEDMAAANAILFGYMTEGTFQKIITVYPDGECYSPDNCRQDCSKDCSSAADRPACQAQCATDRGCDDVHIECEQGNFYADHLVSKDDPTGAHAGKVEAETAILDLMDYIDTNFCTKLPETIDVDGATLQGLY